MWRKHPEIESVTLEDLTLGVTQNIKALLHILLEASSHVNLNHTSHLLQKEGCPRA